MRIIYRAHLIRRLRERKIPENYPKKIIKEPSSEYKDSVTGHKVAVKKLRYNEKTRSIVVVYDIIESTREIITIYPVSDSEIKNRVSSGRWIRYEKN